LVEGEGDFEGGEAVEKLSVADGAGVVVAEVEGCVDDEVREESLKGEAGGTGEDGFVEAEDHFEEELVVAAGVVLDGSPGTRSAGGPL
jgi:hypothetical protein